MKVGDKVVCIETVIFTHTGRVGIKKGNIYSIVNSFTCRCGRVSFDVGVREMTSQFCECHRCSHIITSNYAWVFDSCRFRPIDYSYGTEVCEALETELKEIKQPQLA